MTDIGVGEWVECVDDDSGALFDGGFLVLGRVYQVAELSRAQCDDGRFRASVRLVGQPDRHSWSGRRGSYGMWRFRPIYRPRADLIESLKRPVEAVS